MSENRRIFLLDRSSMQVAPLHGACAPFTNCQVVHFESFADAKKEMSEGLPEFILANWDLPDMKGLALLKQMGKRAETAGIPIMLFTTDRPLSEIRQAMNLGAKDVLGVPIDWNFLHRHLVRIMNETPPQPPGEYEEEEDVEIMNYLDGVTRLTPMPQIAAQVLAISEDPHSSASQLAEIVQKDPVITANVLKLVNSAYYGYRRSISNIQQAIVVLGFDEVRNVTVAASLSQGLNIEGSRLFQGSDFWLHSLATATIAGAIAKRNPKVNADDAFIIGLLHDIGDVILDQHFHMFFEKILDDAEAGGENLSLVERRRLGVDHAEIGGVLARNWFLPVSIEKAILYHHEPWRADEWNHGVFLAHAANLLAGVAGYGMKGNPKPEDPHPMAFETLGLSAETLKDSWDSLELDLGFLRNIL
ncbi:MAG: response regulator [bacterium]